MSNVFPFGHGLVQAFADHSYIMVDNHAQSSAVCLEAIKAEAKYSSECLHLDVRSYIYISDGYALIHDRFVQHIIVESL